MIAGTLALLAQARTEPVTSHDGPLATLDVDSGQETLADDRVVQTGLAAGRVETRTQEVTVTGTSIDVEDVSTMTRVVTEWVADVASGFVLAERTATGTPPFPFGVFRAACETPVEPAVIDTAAFIDSHDDAAVWFTGSDVEGRDDVRMAYHGSASLGPAADPPNVGVGFEMNWGGSTVRGIVYASGYVALYDDSVGPVQFCQFVRDAVLPHASVPDEDDAADAAQTTLDEGDGDGEGAAVTATCERCGRESDTIDGGLCVVCRDRRQETTDAADDGDGDGDSEDETSIADLDTVTISDGGDDDV